MPFKSHGESYESRYTNQQSIECPSCGRSATTGVKDSRHHNKTIRRRRVCRLCKCSFWTIEVLADINCVPLEAENTVAFNWTPEREQELLDLDEQGFSYANIALKMGLSSKNAVSGKLHRMRQRRFVKDPSRKKGEGKKRFKLESDEKAVAVRSTAPKQHTPDRPKTTGMNFYYLKKNEMEFVHFSGTRFTKKEIEAWSGTEKQAQSLVRSVEFLQKKKLDLVFRGKNKWIAPNRQSFG